MNEYVITHIKEFFMSKHKGFTESDVPDQSGKTFIVTGANAGVGFELSRVLAARGARVLLDAVTRLRVRRRSHGSKRSPQEQMSPGYPSIWAISKVFVRLQELRQRSRA
jgi:hypothetical protein